PTQACASRRRVLRLSKRRQPRERPSRSPRNDDAARREKANEPPGLQKAQYVEADVDRQREAATRWREDEVRNEQTHRCPRVLDEIRGSCCRREREIFALEVEPGRRRECPAPAGGAGSRRRENNRRAGLQFPDRRERGGALGGRARQLGSHGTVQSQRAPVVLPALGGDDAYVAQFSTAKGRRRATGRTMSWLIRTESVSSMPRSSSCSTSSGPLPA